MDVMFDTIVTVDWSGGKAKGKKPCADAIWVSLAREGAQELPTYFPSRRELEVWLTTFIETELTQGRRLMIALDFAFGYPAGAARHITHSADPLALWDWLENRIEDSFTENNRFDVAAEINRMFPGLGPYWGNGLKRDIPDLPRKGRAREGHGAIEKRMVEQRAKGSFAVWQLSGAGAVGSQVLMGLPVLSRLRKRFRDQVAAWPFERLDKPVALVEMWPPLYRTQIAQGAYDHWITDAAQVHVVAKIMKDMSPSTLAATLNVPPTPEGWIFGVPYED